MRVESIATEYCYCWEVCETTLFWMRYGILDWPSQSWIDVVLHACRGAPLGDTKHSALVFDI